MDGKELRLIQRLWNGACSGVKKQIMKRIASHQRGALLLEATLALLVFAVGLLLLARASIAAARADLRLRSSAMLERALESKLEQLRANACASWPGGSDTFSDSPNRTIRRNWTCQELWPGFVWFEAQVALPAGGPSYRSASGRRR